MFNREDDVLGTAQGDVMGNGLLMFLFMLILLLPFINDPKQKQADSTDPPNQGVIRVEMFWNDQYNCDIDLWVKGPVGPPVGFSNLSGALWSLKRDDLGVAPSPDFSLRNMEEADTRGIYNSVHPGGGDYVVNVHLFGKKGAADVIDQEGKVIFRAEACPDVVPVKVIVYYRESPTAPQNAMFFSDVKLVRYKQELTVFRWTVKDYKIDVSSLNKIPIHLINPTREDM